MATHPLSGVFAAAITPLTPDFAPDLNAIPSLMDFYANRGLHGALMLGTTGEGPSFSAKEREAIFKAALSVRQDHPDFKLMAGTGTPSLDETAELNKTAYDLGYDAVVTLPPFYFMNASEDGLFDWFSEVIKRSVPSDGTFLGYHFPKVSGVPLSLSLLKRLQDAFPTKFAGLKDSSGDFEHAKALTQELGTDSLILVGNDRLLGPGLENGCSGAITALATLNSLDLRRVWDAFHNGENWQTLQAEVDAGRDVLDKFQPAPAFLKALMPKLHPLSTGPVRPPLTNFDEETIETALAEWQGLTQPA